jgi:hypothetical protein
LTLMVTCLDERGEYIDPVRFRVLLACSYMCRTNADLLLTFMAPVDSVCVACARLCAQCGELCRESEELQDCYQACIACAEACNRLSGVSVLSDTVQR